MEKMKQFKIPHVYVLLCSIIILAVLGTHVLPAGEFNRVMNEQAKRVMVDAASYHRVDASPVSVFRGFMAINEGLKDAASTIFFVFISYASIHLLMKTGALNAFIAWLLRVLSGKKQMVIIPIFMFIFSAGSSVFGLFEESFGFIPIFVGLATAMGFDAIVGLAIVAVSVAIGYSGAAMNPFTVGLAQTFAELAPLSGWQYRIICHMVFLAVSATWVISYANRIKKDPTKSLLYGMDIGIGITQSELENAQLDWRAKSILIFTLGILGGIVWGVTVKGWYLPELSGLFMILGVVSGALAGWRPNKIAEVYVEGVRDIAMAAIMIGLARAILVILREGKIIDTIVYGLFLPLKTLPRWVAAEGMLLIQTMINFVIPSGSGQAATTMPIMAPLADLLNIHRQVAVLAFQFGDGLSNILWPTAFMPVVCGIAHVPVEKWLRWFVPLFGALFAAQAVMIFVAVLINYQ